MPLEFGLEVVEAQLYMPQTLSFYPQLQPETIQHVTLSVAHLSQGCFQVLTQLLTYNPGKDPASGPVLAASNLPGAL